MTEPRYLFVSTLFSLYYYCFLFSYMVSEPLFNPCQALCYCVFVVSWLFPEVSGIFGISVSRDASSEISVQIGPQINIFRCSNEEDLCLVAGISYSNSGIRISLFRNSATLSCVPNTFGSPVSDRFLAYLWPENATFVASSLLYDDFQVTHVCSVVLYVAAWYLGICLFLQQLFVGGLPDYAVWVLQVAHDDFVSFFSNFGVGGLPGR